MYLRILRKFSNMTRMGIKNMRSKKLEHEAIAALSAVFDSGEYIRFAVAVANVSPGTLRNAFEGKGLRPRTYMNIMKAVEGLSKSKAS